MKNKMKNKMTAKQIIKFYESQLDIPNHKLKYILNGPSIDMLIGALGSITHYGEELTEEIFEIFFEVVSAKLAGTYEVEYEFSEQEYENLMSLKQYCKA